MGASIGFNWEGVSKQVGLMASMLAAGVSAGMGSVHPERGARDLRSHLLPWKVAKGGPSGGVTGLDGWTLVLACYVGRAKGNRVLMSRCRLRGGLWDVGSVCEHLRI